MIGGENKLTELEKCLAGQIYDCHAPIFLEYKAKTRRLLGKYHMLQYEQKEEKRQILLEMLGSVGKNVSIGAPFICDYGCHIHIGNNVSINMNCTLVDCNKITIGSNTLIASNVQMYTSTHPVELEERLTPNWDERSGEYFCRTYALPITIGEGVWIGGGAIILPGVTIGNGSVIGAGSVVTKDIPANVVAVGNPCKVIREINNNMMR